MQIVRMGLWKACRCFDPDRGMKLSTLAYVVMKNTLLKQLSKNRRPKKQGILFVSIEERQERSQELGGAEEFASSYDFTEDMATKIDVERMLSFVTPEERVVIIETVLEKKSRAKIAEELNVSSADVKAFLTEGMRKIRENTPHDKYHDYTED